jgi:lauroyl/myristoyl acyltransferase
MSMSSPADLTSALAEARRPVNAPPMPRVAVPLALATSPRLHRLLPAPLAALAGEAHARVAWRASASLRERANATMQAIVAGTERAHEVEALARLHVINSYAQRMLFWQAPGPVKLDEQSLSILRSTLSDGRGVVISCCHLGPFYDVTACARAVARHSFVVAGEWFFERPPANYAGRRIAHWWAKIASRENCLIHSSNSFATLQALLEEGEVALIFFDSVGSRRTTFLGKPVALAGGTARLALATGALVLPVRTRRDRARVWIDVTSPIDPQGFTDIDQLQAAIADVHSALILERPEALENPRRPGAWEHGATGEAWVAPLASVDSPPHG